MLNAWLHAVPTAALTALQTLSSPQPCKQLHFLQVAAACTASLPRVPICQASCTVMSPSLDQRAERPHSLHQCHHARPLQGLLLITAPAVALLQDRRRNAVAPPAGVHLLLPAHLMALTSLLQAPVHKVIPLLEG